MYNNYLQKIKSNHPSFNLLQNNNEEKKMEKIVDIMESIAHEKGLGKENVRDVVIKSLLNTAKKVYGDEYEYEVIIDEKTKNLKLYQKVIVVADDDERAKADNENHMTLSKAKEIDPDIEVGDELTYELPLDNLGRTASAVLQRELEFHIQRLLEDKIFEKYQKKIGSLISGTVVRVDFEENTFIEIDEVRAILPRKNRIKGEVFKVGNVVKSVIRKVYIDANKGMIVELSRTTPKFLEKLLELEVPEIKDRNVIVHDVARIPGERAKVSLSSHHPNIDPVGATVGTRGVRIMAVSKELKNENIDCIEYSGIPEIYITKALSPAIVSNVKIEGKKAIVTLPSDQKSKAIGKSGINIRLASMLSGYEIELVEREGTSAIEDSTKKEEKTTDINALKSLFGE